ncbi:S8 family serine peptidase [Arthrobacter sp. B10-11]|uniref:S8 family serine peptidase n=1 Tax=Arthrobacter sp. B10-11 TaxID=3081160 RepID=UPI0029537304|nr:S8 family serine peptidase [Arthrobacter sp. B10-11]MDV8146972.1 S8 family serine peptidase [Arthrobacter sp. B10-11]
MVALLCGSALPLPAVADDAPLPPAAPAAGRPAGPATTDQFIVKFKDPAAAGPALRTESYGRLARSLGVAVSDVRATATGARVLRSERPLDAGETDKALAALRADPAVEYAEPDVRMYAAATPNDPYYPQQWALHTGSGAMNIGDAWDATKGAGAVVAVIDTGITTHSDLAANVLPGYDMMSDPTYSRDANGRDPSPRDPGDWTSAGMCGTGWPATPSSWHGTQVAGIIAAVSNNGTGTTGVAPQAKILPVRALGPCGGYSSDITDGVVWAAGGSITGLPVNPTPARVINLSLGATLPCSPTFQAAVNFAVARGAAVVAAAGNEDMPASSSSPSNCQNVISVAAVARSGLLAPYSNYGPAVDIAAPGGDLAASSYDGIVVPFNTGTQTPGTEAYAVSEGTSMAAPHAAGLAALLMARLGDLATPVNVETRLKTTATKYAWACVTKTCGSGVLNAAAALDFETDAEITGSTPTIGGQAAVGNYLFAAAGTWTPSDVTHAYQWNRNGTAIPGAQAVGYQVQAADVGATLTVTVTGSRFFGNTVTLTSAPTAPVVPVPVTAPYDPVISGQAITGGVLTANPGVWQPAPVALSYQWHLDGTAIPGATAATYTATAEDKGKALSVRVTGTKDAYLPAERTSAQTAAVATGAVPAAVQFTDNLGTPNDTYTVPSATGVEYLVAGKVVAAGTYTGAGFVRVDARALAGFTLVAGNAATWSHTFSTAVFRDITDGTAFAPEINWLATAGITQGWAEADGTRTFRSAEPVNRDQMAAFLYRLAGNPDFVPPAVSPFGDIPTNHGFYREISWLAWKGISTGWKEANGTRTFRPGATVNRDQMAAFIYRHAGSPDYVPEAQSKFADISTDHGFYKEISWLAWKGISNGWAESNGTRTFRPGASILRDQMAAFMYRYAMQR